MDYSADKHTLTDDGETMTESWCELRARNAINSTEAEGVVLSEETKQIIFAISLGEIDADTVVDEYLAALRSNE